MVVLSHLSNYDPLAISSYSPKFRIEVQFLVPKLKYHMFTWKRLLVNTGHG